MRQNSGSAVPNHTFCINNNKKAKRTTATKATVAAATETKIETATDNNTPHETNCIKR
jgi:hypothetical protein